MRRYGWLILSIIIMSFAFADDGIISVDYNTKAIDFDVPPRIVNDRTLVPIRALLEAYGADLGWDSDTRTVTIDSDGHTVKLKIDSNSAVVDGETVSLDAAPCIENGRTLVPIRFVTEVFGFDINWQESTRTIHIFDLRKSAQLEYGLMPFGVKLTIEEVERVFGAADRVTDSVYGFKWHTYHYDYKNFVMYGVRDDKIVAVYTKSPEMFRGIGLRHGDSENIIDAKYTNQVTEIHRRGKIYNYASVNFKFSKANGAYVRVFKDEIEDNTVSAVMILLAYEEESIPSYYGSPNDSLERDFELQLFDLVNADRVEHGLSTVSLNVDVMSVARGHSQDMINNNYFDHVNPSGEKLIDRLKKAGTITDYAAENIAAGQHNAIMAHEELMNSASHRHTILGPGRYVATGIEFGGEYKHYYTEAFFTPTAQ